ncbi:MAG TPA: trigger factor [Tissierellia bacterium]|jgi:trigger factor|nr:trigger factor [Tissierellia bacterium]
MEYKERSREKNNVVIEYRFSLEELEPFLQKAYQKQRGQFTIPGFRKGKAPRKLLEMHYGEDLFYDEALNQMIPDMYDKSIEELDLHPVSQPHFEMEQLDKEEGVVLTGSVDLYPEVTLGEYKGLKVAVKPVEVTDEEVDAAVEDEREKNARIIPVEGRKTKEGDIVIFDFEGSMDGELFEGGSAEDFELTLGSGHFIPGFEEQMIDMDAGEERDVVVSFPEDYTEELAGKEATFKVKVKEIKEKELPELDDEFAKDVSEEDTLEAYRESLKKNLLEEKEKYAASERENAALEKAIENMEVDIPQSMIDHEVEHLTMMMDYQLRMQGMDLQSYSKMMGLDEDKVKEPFIPQAEKNIRETLLLSEIAKKEEFEITQEDIDKRLEELSAGDEKRLENLKKQHEGDEYKSLKEDISLRKAKELITETMEDES